MARSASRRCSSIRAPHRGVGATPAFAAAVAARPAPSAGSLAALAAQARAAWAAAGADLQVLEGVQIVVADLAGDLLGTTVASDGRPATIYVDIDAAGRGWFIDPTPGMNEEFSLFDGNARYSALTGAAAGRMDLLTLLAHEYGHAAGLGHIQGGAPTVLDTTLNIGERRLPVASDLRRGASADPSAADGLLASGIADGAFDTGINWATRGATTIARGEATLAEDGSFNSSLTQQLRIPQGARFLTFELTDVQFGAGVQSGVGDAFEVALVDLDTGASLLGPIGLSRTNAAINVQQNGRVFAASGVTFDGSATDALPSTAGGPIQVRIDVSAIAATTPALLSFDLLGFGARNSRVSIDDVAFVTDGNVAPVALEPTVSCCRATPPRVLDVLRQRQRRQRRRDRHRAR